MIINDPFPKSQTESQWHFIQFDELVWSDPDWLTDHISSWPGHPPDDTTKKLSQIWTQLRPSFVELIADRLLISNIKQGSQDSSDFIGDEATIINSDCSRIKYLKCPIHLSSRVSCGTALFYYLGTKENRMKVQEHFRENIRIFQSS